VQLENINTVAVIGAGFISPGVAQNFAANGFNVWMFDIKSEMLPNAVNRMKYNLTTMAQKGIIEQSEVEQTLSKVKTTEDIKQAVESAQFVIECITENLELKQKVFKQIDEIADKNTIIASNSSVIRTTEIAAMSANKYRMLGVHFWNPAHLIPCVEIIKAEETSEEVFDLTCQLIQKAGKKPIRCLKDVPGFVANRLQHALWREAVSIVEQGIADAATVDEAIKTAFAVRLPVLGPMENMDMIGLDLVLSIHQTVLPAIESKPGPSPLLEEKVKNGELGFKTGKGFQTWTPEQVTQSRDKLNEYLLDWLASQKKK